MAENNYKEKTKILGLCLLKMLEEASVTCSLQGPRWYFKTVSADFDIHSKKLKVKGTLVQKIKGKKSDFFKISGAAAATAPTLTLALH